MSELPTTAVTDARLAEHRCVWCGTPLQLGPDMLFDRPECQESWHTAANGGDPLPPVGPTPGPYPHGPPMPPGSVPANPDSEPWWVPRSAYAARHLRRLLGSAPAGIFTAFSGMLPDSQIQQLEDDYPHRPGMMAPAPQRSDWHSPEPQLGPHDTNGCRWALEEITPEPLPRQPWPTDTVAMMRRAGFDTADQRCPLPPVRTCPRCTEIAAPAVVYGRWGRVVTGDGGLYEGDELAVETIDGPRMACSACAHHYPGPDLIPMARYTDDGWEFATVGGIYSHRWRITDQALAHLADPDYVAHSQWDRSEREVRRQLNPWKCALPDCPGPADVWFLLGARLAWRGWLWACADDEPLRLGLCASHQIDLHRTVFASADRLVNVAAIHTGSRLAVA